MIERTELLKSAAAQIDALDREIRDLNDNKKYIFGNIRETVPPADFKAWREAVKLRQKRRADKVACEAHDELVWAMLSMLEAETGHDDDERPVAPAELAAIAPQTETASHAGAQAHIAREATELLAPVSPDGESAGTKGAGAEVPAHDPATGDIIEKPVTDSATPFNHPAFQPLEIPQLPEFLDRNLRKLTAAA